jgi:hypothetical protein
LASVAEINPVRAFYGFEQGSRTDGKSQLLTPVAFAVCDKLLVPTRNAKGL